MGSIERQERPGNFVLLVHEGFTNHSDGIVTLRFPERSGLYGEILPHAFVDGQAHDLDPDGLAIDRQEPILTPIIARTGKKSDILASHPKQLSQDVEDPRLTGRYRHDFRRTAVRNMERRGLPRSVATKITGHRTESVYRRYAIVSDADLKEAARKLTGTLTGTAAHSKIDEHRQVHDNQDTGG